MSSLRYNSEDRILSTAVNSAGVLIEGDALVVPPGYGSGGFGWWSERVLGAKKNTRSYVGLNGVAEPVRNKLDRSGLNA